MSDEKDKDIDIVELLVSGIDESNRAQIDSSQLKHIRGFVDNFDRKKNLEGKGYIAQAYVAARRSRSFSGTSIAKALNLNYTVYKKYLDTDPEFAAAIRLGIMDGKSDMEDELLSSLYKKAVGYVAVEESVQQDGTVASDGTEFYNKISKKTSSKDVPPDSQALLLLLQKLNPSWAQKANEPQTNSSLSLNESSIVKDVSVDVDYKKLSSSTLKELLLSDKDVRDSSLFKTEQGQSVLSLYPSHKEDYNPKPREEWETKKNKRKWTKEAIEAANKKRAETWKRKREEKEKLAKTDSSGDK